MEAVLAIEIMEEPHSNLEQKVKPSILKPAEFSQYWNQQATSYPTLQGLVDWVQVQKLIQVLATNQMPDHT